MTRLPLATFGTRFGHAVRGIRTSYRRERHVRLQSAAVVVVFVSGLVAELSSGEWIALIFAVTLVLAFEIANSAFEHLADLVKPRLHGQVQLLKDMMAGAVLVASCGAAAVGLIVFLPRLIEVAAAVWYTGTI